MGKTISAIVVVAVLSVGGAYYGSPYWAVYQMQAAAKAREGDRLAVYVDFPAVRESLKSQLQAMMLKRMQSQEVKDSPFAAMGMMLAGGMLNLLVDQMITPESVAIMIDRGKAKTAAGEAIPAASDNSSVDSGKSPRVERRYEGMSVFKVELHDPQTDAPALTLVLNREGWFGWKLKAIRLESLAGD